MSFKDKYFYLSILVILVIAIFVLSINSNLNNNVQNNIISVKGTYEKEVEPDLAVIYLTIKSSDSNAQKAADNCKKISNKVLSALKKDGLKEEEYFTEGLSLYKKKEWDSIIKDYVDKGFEASYTIKIRTSRFDKLGSFISTALDNGVNEVSGINFLLSDEKKSAVKKILLEEAAKNARLKANSLASVLNKEVIDVINIKEESSYFPVPYRALGSSLLKENDFSIKPKNIKVSSTVSVLFKMK